jgi:16S rRNA (adenine1518-N6/adenine1519-N6)-dimethyltransferase
VTLTRRDVRELLGRYDVRPSRARGQHFVVDPNTVRRVVRLAGVGPDDRVVEVGAGIGSLTLALAETGADVLAIEVDRRLLPALREVVGPAGVTVVEGDAMRLDWNGLLGDGPWMLVANLPYNIATPLVATLLDEVPVLERLVVMVQREVAERLAAVPGTPAYGAVSVKVAYWATADVVGVVPPTVFWPQPKVESAVVSVRRRPATDQPPVDPERQVRVGGAGFAHRRKMLRRALAGLLPPEAFPAVGVAPEARAEDLDVATWARLAAWSSPAPSTSTESERPPS